MYETEIEKFADLLLTFTPDFPMDSHEIKQRLKTQGLDALINDSDPHYMSLLETAELLISLEEGVDKNEPR